MTKVKRDYCNGCRRHTTFIYVNHDEHSVIARCEDCGGHYDLINHDRALSEFRRSNNDRITYYIDKLRQYSDARYDYLRRASDIKPPDNRFQRLLSYRDAIYARVEVEGM